MGLNKFPITVQECYDIINHALSLDKDSFNNEFSDDYLKALDNWNRFLGTIIFTIDTINSSSKKNVNIKELIDKGYIK